MEQAFLEQMLLWLRQALGLLLLEEVSSSETSAAQVLGQVSKPVWVLASCPLAPGLMLRLHRRCSPPPSQSSGMHQSPSPSVLKGMESSGPLQLEGNMTGRCTSCRFLDK